MYCRAPRNRNDRKAVTLCGIEELAEINFGFLEIRGNKIVPVILEKRLENGKGEIQGVLMVDAVGNRYSMACVNMGREWRVWAGCPTTKQREEPWIGESIKTSRKKLRLRKQSDVPLEGTM